MESPTALITGITGQDGSYLTELLLSKGYTVHGVVRRSSMFNRSRIEHLRADPGIYQQRLFLHYADLHDATSLRRILNRTQPEEVYHLAGQSHVGLSFEIPESTCQEVAGATLSLLEICRDLEKPVRLYLASSSEIFGNPLEGDVPQDENTGMRPTSPYGCAKAFATQLGRVYRDAFGLYVCSGITYNHESPRRGGNFVTRKITSSAARIAAGAQADVALGNLDAVRDWGYAPEYVQAMWMMLQRDMPADFVLATGRPFTVRDFAQAAFAAVGLELAFEGQGVDEVGRDRANGRIVLRVEPKFYRPVDPARLLGDPEPAAERLGWRAQTLAPQLAALMAADDLRQFAPDTVSALSAR